MRDNRILILPKNSYIKETKEEVDFIRFFRNKEKKTFDIYIIKNKEIIWQKSLSSFKYRINEVIKKDKEVNNGIEFKIYTKDKKEIIGVESLDNELSKNFKKYNKAF